MQHRLSLRDKAVKAVLLLGERTPWQQSYLYILPRTGSLPTVASVTAAGLRGRARFKTIHRAPLLCPRTTMTRALGTTLSGLRTSTAGRSNSGCRNSFRLRLVCPHVVTCRSGREDDPKSGGGILRSALTLGQSGLLPKRLLSVTRPRQSLDQEQHLEGQASGSGQNKTVFTVRLTTSSERNSQLTSPYGGIWMCLIGKDGSSYLRRFSPVVDSQDLQREFESICEVDDWEGMGANCATSQLPSAPQRASMEKRRFVEGSIDEESFVGPELGPLAAVIIGPEEGTWRLHEMNVSSSRSGHTDRFICRERMGDSVPDRSAVFLTPVPENAVVYGSGESAVIMTKEEAQKIYQLGIQDYSEMKSQLLLTNFVLVCSGSSVAALIGGTEACVPFAAGGALGILYQQSLQNAADSLPSSLPEDYDTNPLNRNVLLDSSRAAAQSLTNQPSARLFMASVLGYLIFIGIQRVAGAEGGSAISQAQMLEVTTAMFSGFLMYKVAVLAVTLTPTDPVDVGSVVKNNVSGEN